MQPEPEHIVNKRIILLVSLVILVGIISLLGVLFKLYNTPGITVDDEEKVLEVKEVKGQTISEKRAEILKRADSVSERPLTKEERDYIMYMYDGERGPTSPEEMKKVINALNQ
jgi:hypothetical protein